MAFRFYHLILTLLFTLTSNLIFAEENNQPKFKLSYWKQEHNFDKTGFVYASIEGSGAEFIYNATDYFYLTIETLSLDYNYLVDYDFDQFTGASRVEIELRQKLYGIGFQYSFTDNIKAHIEFNDLESVIDSYRRDIFYGERSEVGLSYSPLDRLEFLLAYSKQSIDHQSSDTFVTELSYQVMYGLGVFYQYRNSEQDSSSTRFGVVYQF
jgi:hypothetical protein